MITNMIILITIIILSTRIIMIIKIIRIGSALGPIVKIKSSKKTKDRKMMGLPTKLTTYQIPNMQKKVKVNVLDQLIFTMQYNHGMIIVIKV